VPPRWKFAVVVWLAIYPSLTFLVWLAGPEIAHFPLALRTLVFTVVLVPWMVLSGAADAPASPRIVRRG
jgi:antibiotic biosynthesis monooxygenase (ABM) superfamily enzyme